MAKFGLRSNNQGNGCHFFMGLVCVMLLVQMGSAKQFTVGDSRGWAVPENANTNSYNQWAERNRFQIGDSLLFKYDSSQDSVLLVTKENYDSCHDDSPVSSIKDVFTFNHSGPFYFISGNKDVFTFNHSGPFYFISGNKGNCQKNEKLVVIVLADRTKTSEAAPPTPAGSPPNTTVEPSPMPPPTDHDKNAAFLSITGSISYVGALLFASSLALVL